MTKKKKKALKTKKEDRVIHRTANTFVCVCVCSFYTLNWTHDGALEIYEAKLPKMLRCLLMIAIFLFIFSSLGSLMTKWVRNAMEKRKDWET